MNHDLLSSESGFAWLRLWAESTSDFSIFALSRPGVVATWNPGGERMQGYRPDEIIGQPLALLYPLESRALGAPEAALHAAAQTGRHVEEGWRIRKDGTPFWANVAMTALRDGNNALIGFGTVISDMSDKKAAHDAVLKSERNFRLLVQGVTDYAIFMLSTDGHITSWNAGARRIKGYTEAEIIGSHFSRFYTPEDVAAGVPFRGLETARRDGRFEAEGWRVRCDGSRFFAHVIIDAIYEDGELVGFAKVTRDITERRRAGEQLEQTQRALFQAQKMEALGKLTGGVAHDFNNVLQVLRGNLELLENRHGRDAWSAERLNNAIDAVDRGAKLAAQLLAFGRQQPLAPVVINPARQLRAMDDLLRRALGEAIEIESVVAGGLWNTAVDPHQLENVILNLAINARDAMPEGGKLTLELSNATLDDGYVSALPDVPAGQYVMLAVTDTGTGMSPEVMERAFDPFFSTKREGEGTGLGLSMAYGFVKQSGGHIRLYSEVGEGTTVRVYLPRSTGTAVEPARVKAGALKHGNETILVVEDDAKVRETVVDLLSGLGYAVLKANNAEQALAVVESGVHIDLLFTDVVMPGALRSTEMVQRAVQTLPALKVLYTSGYTQNAIVHGGRLDPGVELLSKPYSRQQLAFKIRQVLGSDAVQASGPEEGDTPPDLDTGAVWEPARLRILVVEDDASLRGAVCELLMLIGITPQQAASGAQALEALQAEAFDVLFTDLIMPDMSGIKLAQHAFALHPELRVVFASGNPIPNHDRFAFRWTALRKPYTLDQLQHALQSMMARQRAATDT
ncbi:PAS domain S-box-containing protein [Ralstonia sp. GP73]|jgi:PAS domain S-box-containing protein|uniref:histidine kinase n=2 Tax=Pseudomonadota TaxID=1224 RepID=A0AAD2F278_9RALS|nr:MULTISPECIES: PAS domain S-box protein [Ralstonia]MBT2180512.1 PAS domain S-box protein [Ralstonia pickettii]MDH6640698.1 PAS domain S-box-containing protein [Ralstonia sp. GP73]OCS52302.1 hybrid sensor histidine kinase/response regulator [Ralstonia pickettii]CAJ0708023.1 Sensor histidine kinase RcsC [Ralstonia sp. LMG 18095]CAJ0778619.1 Sensor histidine kinase RcsC [Ralstonia sp. LMG 18095]